MSVERPKYSEEDLDVIFAKATLILGDLRKDVMGQYVHRQAHGDAEHPWGWDVDHIKAIKDGGSNNLDNLRPLNIHDNRGRNNTPA